MKGSIEPVIVPQRNDSQQRAGNGQAHQHPVLSIEARKAPRDRDPDEADRAQNESQEKPGEDLPAHHHEPVAQLDLTQGEGADDQGCGLRSASFPRWR